MHQQTKFYIIGNKEVAFEGVEGGAGSKKARKCWGNSTAAL